LTPHDGLWIDLTGCAHLHGEQERFCRRLRAFRGRAGFTARVAVADTAGGAHALAYFGPADITIVQSGKTAEALMPLSAANPETSGRAVSLGGLSEIDPLEIAHVEGTFGLGPVSVSLCGERPYKAHGAAFIEDDAQHIVLGPVSKFTCSARAAIVATASITVPASAATPARSSRPDRGEETGVSKRKIQAKVSTGIGGLDQILRGGLPSSNLYIMQGAPGAGKTTAALQFLRAGVEAGERCIYVSLSQTAAELTAIAQSHGWTLDGIRIEELSASDAVNGGADQTIFQTAELRLDETRQAIEQAIEEHKPQRLVYDSLLEIRLITGDTPRFRRELLGFKAFLAKRNVVALLLDTQSSEAATSGEEVDGYHDMAIREGEGVVVFPRIIPGDAVDTRKAQLIKSGVDTLDAMFGGGQESGTTTLVIGQSGTGKSTMASLYATAALQRGEHVALFLFEERLETFFRRSEGLGMDLRQFYKDGQLIIRDFNPNEISPGEFAQIVQSIVTEFKTRVVVIDSFTGYLNSLPHREKAVRDIQSLLKYLARSGVLTMLIVAQHGLLGQNVGIDVDVSFLGDTVLLLRIMEDEGRLRRNITVVKKRHGPHDLDVHELFIKSSGITVVPFNPLPTA
jgi:circadian clock protein KaiC